MHIDPKITIIDEKFISKNHHWTCTNHLHVPYKIHFGMLQYVQFNKGSYATALDLRIFC